MADESTSSASIRKPIPTYLVFLLAIALSLRRGGGIRPRRMSRDFQGMAQVSDREEAASGIARKAISLGHWAPEACLRKSSPLSRSHHRRVFFDDRDAHSCREPLVDHGRFIDECRVVGGVLGSQHGSGDAGRPEY